LFKIEDAMLHVSRWKTILIWCVVAAGVLIALPNLFGTSQLASFPAWIADSKVKLGLDLQGGSDLMLKVERDDVIAQRLEDTVSDIRTRLRTVNVGYTGLTGTGQAITVRIPAPNQVQAAMTALAPLAENVTSETSGSAFPEATLTAGPDGQITVNLTDRGIDRRISLAIKRSTDIIRRRVVDVADAAPSIRRQGFDRLVVQEPGLTDPQLLKSLLNQKAGLSFRLIDQSIPVQQAIDGQMPAGSEVLYSEDDPPVAYLLQRQPMLSNVDIADAQATVDARNDSGTVTIRLNAEAAGRFARSTQASIGKPVAIVLDDQIIATVMLTTAIPNGSVDIAGVLSAKGAQDLAVMLRSGPLPATLTAVEERTIRPGFGSETMHSGVVACIAAGIFVAVLMIGFYGLLGVAAILALAINIVLVLAVMGVLGMVLTLPGLAAIVLIIGISLDANVLIYERVREEEKKTHLLVDALRHGFARAVKTVIDANLTVLIVAAILFYVSKGTVRGFAATLVVGLVTTFFTACLVTRSIVDLWISRRKPRTLLDGVRSGIFDGSRIRFMGIRRYTFTASAILSLATLLAIATVGMHLGIDFTGGSIVEVRAKQGLADTTNIESRLDQLNLGAVQVSGTRDRSSALIRVHAQNGGENAEQSAVTLVRDELATDYDFSRVEVVGPAVSGEIAKTASLGLLAALVAVFVYIWLRFAWQFAIGAIVAILHDIILMLGLFVLTGMEFNLISVAALLTVVGYSLNDTIVVYDRMRENIRRYPRMPMPILIDASINQTLSRTVLTSATTFLALLALFIFGGEVIRSFTLAMLFGVAIGTFSSIYIAAPVLIVFRLRSDSSRTDEGKTIEADVQSGRPAV
jgi:SecD/SecF fusion protein